MAIISIAVGRCWAQDSLCHWQAIKPLLVRPINYKQSKNGESSKTLYLILGNPESCTFSENGGVYFGHVDTFISPNEIIATQVMLYNYCLLEAYEFDLMKQKMYENQELFFDEKYSLKDFNERGFEKLINGVVERELVRYERQSVEKRLNLWKKFDL